MDLSYITNAERKFGPIQIMHDFQFVPLNVSEDYSYIKDLSKEEKLEDMTKRIKRLYDCGYGGVVLNVDFENYLNNEQSFILLDKVVDVAYNMGMRVWLYDEQYYPSGSAGGLVLKEHPELEGSGLVCVKREIKGNGTAVRVASPYGHSELKYAFAVPKKDGEYRYSEKVDISTCKDVAGGLCWDCDGGQWLIYCYFVRALYEMTYLAFSFRASRRYPSIADKRAMERFVKLTYDNYEKFLKKPLGNRVEAVFTDEPSLMFYLKYPEDRNPDSATQFSSISIYDRPDLKIPAYPYVPWTGDIAESFYRAYNYKITDFLPELFDETAETRRVRCDFYEHINKLVEEAYIGTLSEYTASQNMLLSGHYLREECFNRHPFMYGDILRHIGGMDIPGCDRLYSAPDMLKHSLACKLASSAAHIYHKKHAMIEISNMIDENQDFSLDDIIKAMTTIFIHGIDTITSYYGERLFSDDDTKKFTRYVSRLNKLLDGGAYRITALLYYPFEQLCAVRMPDGPDFDEETMLDTLCVKKTAELLFNTQTAFDFINKENLLKCKVEHGKLLTDYGEEVNVVAFPDIPFIDPDVAEFLNRANEAGVKIVIYGKEKKFEGINFVPEFVNDEKQFELLQNNRDLYLDGIFPDIIFLHKTVGKRDYYIIQNTGNVDESLNVSLSCTGSAVYRLDLLADEVTAQKIDFDINNKHTCFNLNMSAGSFTTICIERA